MKGWAVNSKKHVLFLLFVKHHLIIKHFFPPSSSLFKAPESLEPFNGQNAPTAASTQNDSSSSHSRATHSHALRNPSTSSFTHQQTQIRDSPQLLSQVQAQPSDGGIHPGLASTLEHIIGQLDILTQVRLICEKPQALYFGCATHTHCSEQKLPWVKKLFGLRHQIF